MTYDIQKYTPWFRMTETEASDVDALIQAQSPRWKQIYYSYQYFNTGETDVYSVFYGLLVTALGQTRADEIVAP